MASILETVNLDLVLIRNAFSLVDHTSVGKHVLCIFFIFRHVLVQQKPSSISTKLGLLLPYISVLIQTFKRKWEIVPFPQLHYIAKGLAVRLVRFLCNRFFPGIPQNLYDRRASSEIRACRTIQLLGALWFVKTDDMYFTKELILCWEGNII